MLQDQIAPQTSATKKRFAVHSDQLKSVARIINLPSRSSETIAMTLSTNELRLSASTKNGDFSVAMTIEPIRPLNLAEGETIGFEIPKQLLSSLGHHYDCELSFELDRDQETLTWQGLGRLFHLGTQVRCIAAQDDAEDHHHLATLESRVLRDAIAHAATLIDKRTANTQAFDGLEVSGGSAKSGYVGGISLYKSGALPGALSFILPKRNVPNALAVIGKMQGPINMTETERTAFVKSGQIELSWRKTGRCPSLDRILGAATQATFDVMVAEALSSVLIARIGSDRGRMVLDSTGQNPSLSLLSIAPFARYELALNGKLRECHLEPGTKLAFNINLADLQRVLDGIRTPNADLSILQHGLILKSAGADYDEISVLSGID